MGKVYLIHGSRRGLDLSSAAPFGEIVTVLEARDSPSLAVAPSLVKLRSFVKEYDPAEDFVLYAGGDPLGALMVGMLLVDEGKSVNWLRWDRNRDFDGRRDMSAGQYVPLHFDLRGIKKDEWEDDEDGNDR